ncbi:MAG: phosphoribosylglycinamide formyltransferase [Rudaea sp.]
MASLPIVVLCSRRGSNLQALIDVAAAGALPISIRAVLSDRPGCTALKRARKAGIATDAMRPRDFAARRQFDEALFARAGDFDPALIVLAGYMRIIDAAVVRAWQGRMINIHPSLLPNHPGLDTHAGALAAGDTRHGASVHFVTPELDGGPVIAQVAIPVHAGDSTADLATRLLPFEHRLLVASVALLAAGAIRLDADRVSYRDAPLATPLQMDERGRLRTG